jgi:hypothetical protein
LQLPAINVIFNGNVFITVAFTSNISPTWTSLGTVIIFSSLTPVTNLFTKSSNVEIAESLFVVDCAEIF